MQSSLRDRKTNRLTTNNRLASPVIGISTHRKKGMHTSTHTVQVHRVLRVPFLLKVKLMSCLRMNTNYGSYSLQVFNVFWPFEYVVLARLVETRRLGDYNTKSR